AKRQRPRYCHVPRPRCPRRPRPLPGRSPVPPSVPSGKPRRLQRRPPVAGGGRRPPPPAGPAPPPPPPPTPRGPPPPPGAPPPPRWGTAGGVGFGPGVSRAGGGQTWGGPAGRLWALPRWRPGGAAFRERPSAARLEAACAALARLHAAWADAAPAAGPCPA